jgi:hypothetical protein
MFRKDKIMDLDDVLNEYVSAFPDIAPNHSQMMEWIRQYPQFEPEICEFTVSWCVMDTLKVERDPSLIVYANLQERGLKIVKDVIARKNKEYGIDKSLWSL